MDFCNTCDTSIVLQKRNKSKPISHFRHNLDKFHATCTAPFLVCTLFPHEWMQSPTTETTEFPTLPEIVVEGTDGCTNPISNETVKHFTISLVGEVRGELEPCGCPTLPYGGFPRRAKALKEIRDNNNSISLGCR